MTSDPFMEIVEGRPVSGAQEFSSIKWWNQYIQALRGGPAGRPWGSQRISEQSIAEIERLANRIICAIPPGFTNGEGAASNVLGAVVGSVQSGKTAAMIGITAKALDCGFKIILVLAGLKDDLRTQTARRFVKDLLWRGDPLPTIKDGGPPRYDHPLGRGLHGSLRGCWSLNSFEDVNDDQSFRYQMVSNLRAGRNAIVVTKKNLATLSTVADTLAHCRNLLDPKSLPMLVLDDECDEATVSGDLEAPTPQYIARLWGNGGQPIAYVGMTATIAANILQVQDSETYPRDFIEVLRYPATEDKSLQYADPSPDRRYTGGHTFYEYLESRDLANFLLRTKMSDPEAAGHSPCVQELEEALIAYFVAGAIRLCEQPGNSFSNPMSPPMPHCMLIHTESLREEHWALCSRIMRQISEKEEGGTSPHTNVQGTRPDKRLEASWLSAWLARESDRWREWHTSFSRSRRDLLQACPEYARGPFPTWEEALARLPDVFQNTKLRVINSDGGSDPSLDFARVIGPSGQMMPYDVYSIVIGGNRLSRGLTIEGLCISYYTRTSATFAEDTTVQRERWFGFRGPHLEFCRIFTTEALGTRLRRFHEHDDDLRRQFVRNVEEGRAPVDASFRFLCLSDSSPTLKASRGKSGAAQISGLRLFIGRVQMGTDANCIRSAESNQEVAASLSKWVISAGSERNSPDGRTCLGWVARDVEVSQVIEALERMGYTFHNPDPGRGLQKGLEQWYRPSRPDSTICVALPPRSDPYFISAYLRYWKDAWDIVSADPARNRYRASDGIHDWDPAPPPLFNIGLRAGSLAPQPGSLFCFRLLNREVQEEGFLPASWGGHGESAGYEGDEWFDIDPPRERDTPRDAGMPGLLLLHVIGRDARGRSGNGSTYCLDRPTYGIVVPRGGPSFRYIVADPERE